MIIDHKHQMEGGKDREEYWIHMIIGMLKSDYVNLFKDVKPKITKTGDLLEFTGLNTEKEILTTREIKVDGKVMKYKIRLCK